MRADPALEQLICGCVPFEAQVGVVRAERDAVPPGELARFPSTWSEKRAREHWAGRQASARALARYGLLVDVGRADDGVPLFPTGTSGSIAHTGSKTVIGACLVTRAARSVGIDIEGRQSLAPELIERIVDEEESARLAQFGSDRGIAALWAFCAKEAYYKCVFPSHRRFLGFHEVSFRCEEPTSAAPRVERWHEGSEQAPPLVGDCRLGEKAIGDSLLGRVLVTDEFVISIVWSP